MTGGPTIGFSLTVDMVGDLIAVLSSAEIVGRRGMQIPFFEDIQS